VSRLDYRGTDPDRGVGEGLGWRLRRPVVPAAKAALRAYGMATASARPLPDFLVIGAKRGGSTSLYRNLVETPGVLALWPRVEDLKGTYYFDVEFGRGERWYRSHFPTASARGGALVGEASPYYLSHPHAARRAAELVPDARVVVLLRDPVARAHSHYKERVKQGIEHLASFEAALDAEDERLAGELERMLDDPTYVSANHLNFGYRAQSEYGAALERWLAAYPRAQVLVLRSEDFYADEGGVLDRVRGFLGLEPARLERLRHYNDTGPSGLDDRVADGLRIALADDQRKLADLLGEPTSV